MIILKVHLTLKSVQQQSFFLNFLYLQGNLPVLTQKSPTPSTLNSNIKLIMLYLESSVNPGTRNRALDLQCVTMENGPTYPNAEVRLLHSTTHKKKTSQILKVFSTRAV